MTYIVKIRTLPGSPMMAEYICPVHGRFELLVERDEHGDPPQEVVCEIMRDHEHYCEEPPCGDCGFTVYECGLSADLVISAPSIKFWSRDPIPVGRASKSDEKDPRALDTEPLATGKMTKAEWTKWQRGISRERNHQKRIKSGKRQKRIQIDSKGTG
jgi:hypothetical protein